MVSEKMVQDMQEAHTDLREQRGLAVRRGAGLWLLHARPLAQLPAIAPAFQIFCGELGLPLAAEPCELGPPPPPPHTHTYARSHVRANA